MIMENFVEFKDAVNKALKEGWVCIGGCSHSNSGQYIQAMVKYED